MNAIRPLALLLVAASLTLSYGCATTTTERLSLEPLQAVSEVDLNRYTGTWYEIASYPQSFQEGCTGTTAHYRLRKDGQIAVTNRCFRGSLDGEETVAEGFARVMDERTRAKLEVSFFRPFWGEYWIIELGDDYEYAVVGHPSRDYLWILARKPQLDEATYQALLTRVSEVHGYPLDRLEQTVQPVGFAAR